MWYESVSWKATLFHSWHIELNSLLYFGERFSQLQEAHFIPIRTMVTSSRSARSGTVHVYVLTFVVWLSNARYTTLSHNKRYIMVSQYVKGNRAAVLYSTPEDILLFQRTFPTFLTVL
jgi:hypothetical protein